MNKITVEQFVMELKRWYDDNLIKYLPDIVTDRFYEVLAKASEIAEPTGKRDDMPEVCHLCDYSNGASDEWCAKYSHNEDETACVLKEYPGKYAEEMALEIVRLREAIARKPPVNDMAGLKAELLEMVSRPKEKVENDPKMDDKTWAYLNGQNGVYDMFYDKIHEVLAKYPTTPNTTDGKEKKI